LKPYIPWTDPRIGIDPLAPFTSPQVAPPASPEMIMHLVFILYGFSGFMKHKMLSNDESKDEIPFDPRYL
jgi:hypothetical protein